MRGVERTATKRFLSWQGVVDVAPLTFRHHVLGGRRPGRAPGRTGGSSLPRSPSRARATASVSTASRSTPASRPTRMTGRAWTPCAATLALRPVSALRWRGRPPRLPDETSARQLALVDIILTGYAGFFRRAAVRLRFGLQCPDPPLAAGATRHSAARLVSTTGGRALTVTLFARHETSSSAGGKETRCLDCCR
jgi:hypothetical protein